MRVKCINVSSNTYLTVGKEYEVVRVDRDYYTVVNDSNSNFKYYKFLFEIVKEKEKMKKVKCVSVGNNCLIEVDKIYDVVRENLSGYFIDPNNTGLINYNKNLFVEVTDMTKSNLKVGMVVENRNGEKSLVLNSTLNGMNIVRNDCHGTFTNYKEDLTNDTHKKHDIIKVFEFKKFSTLKDIFDETNLTLLWERKENIEEINKLKADISSIETTLKDMKNKLNSLEV